MSGLRAGIRLRLGLQERPQESDPASQEIVALYSKGDLTAARVGRLASAVQKSGVTTPVVKRLARAKPRGVMARRGKIVPDTRNSSRAVRRALGSGNGLPPLYIARIPTWDATLEKKIESPMSFLLPHEMLQRIVPEGDEERWCSFSDKGA